jgi:hypothetical protein
MTSLEAKAWVVGDEPCVFLDFSGMETYATGR